MNHRHNDKHRLSLLPALCLAVAGLFYSLPSQAIYIDFNVAPGPVNVGDTVSVDIVVGDLTAAGEIVQAFDLFVGFDSSIVSLTSVALGATAAETFTSDTLSAIGTAFELDFSFLGALGFGTNTMSLSALSLVPSILPFTQGDTVLLGTLAFNAIAAGTSNLSFLNHPVLGFPADVKGFDPINPLNFASIGTGLINVNAVAVPEPGTMGLLGAGLLLLRPWLGRRRLRV